MAIDPSYITAYFQKETKAAPLAVFRILFGLLMFISIIRFWALGWIEKLYLTPKFHFHYSGFEFIQVPGLWTYLLFAACGISALCVSAGFKYRIALSVFFLSFGYIELMDKTTYLNHYYFVSVVSFILLWLPAHVYFSVDAHNQKSIKSEYIPKWNIDILKLMLAIVYIYAGVAKLNYDWLFKAMPLAIWLPTKMDIPLLGSLMHERWMHFLFSWGGAIYDLFIVFFLLWKRTRVIAFLIVIIFHILTRVLFPIGMFPYIMITGTLIFFEAGFHEKILDYISKLFNINKMNFQNGKLHKGKTFDKLGKNILIGFMVFQLLFPLRYLLYNGNVFWTENGYRFAWRVMLMEKTGYANFKIVDGKSGKRFYVQNDDFLTSLQQKQMATQPDFILEYGQYLGDHFTSQGHKNVEVYVESYAALNGRQSQEFVDPKINLMTISERELKTKYIFPLK